MFKLYNYYRSSASYRVRIALNLKGLPFEYIPVHLVKDGGAQFAPEFKAMNPDSLVPVLIEENAAGQNLLNQSLAIMEYLEETQPNSHKLLPGDALQRAQIRALSLQIACEIHPLNNLRVLRYLMKNFGASEEQKNTWYRHWVEQGLTAFETTLARSPLTGKFCVGDTPTMADCCLVPQIANAKRFNCDLSAMPHINRIIANCMAVPEIERADWANQPDAE